MTQTRFPTITEDSVATLVDAFYARVRGHPALGPIFDAAIAEEEWPEHLESSSASGRR
jgi:hemoglobin